MCFRSSANQIFSHAPLASTLLSFIISPLSFRETDAYRTSVKHFRTVPNCLTQEPPQLFDRSVTTCLTFMAHGGSNKNSSRVPRYQNLKLFGGFCEKFFKPLTMWGEVW